MLSQGYAQTGDKSAGVSYVLDELGATRSELRRTRAALRAARSSRDRWKEEALGWRWRYRGVSTTR